MSDLTAELPTTLLPDGRHFIADQDMVEHPHVRDFIRRFSNYWQRDDLRCGWVSPLPESAPQ